jgi:hypothetical protein
MSVAEQKGVLGKFKNLTVSKENVADPGRFHFRNYGFWIGWLIPKSISVPNPFELFCDYGRA